MNPVVAALDRIGVRSSLVIETSTRFKKGRLAVDDTMVHEMLHAWLHITGQDTKHSGKAWYAAVRRLSPIVLGHELDARRGADRRSVRIKLENGSSVVRKIPNPDAGAHAMVAGWPIRPEGYDFGEPIDCPSY